jgi:hypothetical protein
MNRAQEQWAAVMAAKVAALGDLRGTRCGGAMIGGSSDDHRSTHVTFFPRETGGIPVAICRYHAAALTRSGAAGAYPLPKVTPPTPTAEKKR